MRLYGTILDNTIRVAQKNQKCANLFRKYLMWCSITQGLLEHFYFSQKWVLRVSQGGSIIKKVDFQDVPNYPMWVL